MKILMLTLILAACALQAKSELRIWTDENGKTIEAEHVRTLTDQVVLRQSDGTELRVSLGTLSERDRRYAIVLTPPRLDINVSRKKSSTNTSGPNNYGPGTQKTDEVLTVTATLRKTSSAPYEAPLRAELYLLGAGSQSEGYVVLDKTIERISYTAESGTTQSFSSNDVNLQQVEHREKRGVQYEGYLLAVYDKAGDVISMKCSKLAFEKNADAVLDSGRGTVFDKSFKVMGKKKGEPGARNKTTKPEEGRTRKRYFRTF